MFNNKFKIKQAHGNIVSLFIEQTRYETDQTINIHNTHTQYTQ